MARADIDRFDDRAESYEHGRLGAWHRLVADRTAAVASAALPAGGQVLDVGCGTGLFLRSLAARLPAAVELVGVDPAERMLAVARASVRGDARFRFVRATAEQLPIPADSFDLVASTLSFDHWEDQLAGLVECYRVLRPGGTLVVADLFAAWLWPSAAGRSRRARTRHRAEALLERAAFRSIHWERIVDLGPLPLVRAAVAAP